MKVQCPECGFTSQIDDSKVPDKGAYTRCRKCHTRFFLSKETDFQEKTSRQKAVPKKKDSPKDEVIPQEDEDSPKDEVIPQEDEGSPKEEMIPQEEDMPQEEEIVECPKCNHKQPPSNACMYCGTPLSLTPRDTDKKEKKEEASRQVPPRQRTKMYEATLESASLQNRSRQPGFSSQDRIGEKGLRYIINEAFDFSFSNLITPDLMKAIYVLGILLGGIVAAISFGIFLSKGDGEGAAIVFLSYFLFALLGRIGVELTIIIFKIEENTRKGIGD